MGANSQGVRSKVVKSPGSRELKKQFREQGAGSRVKCLGSRGRRNNSASNLKIPVGAGRLKAMILGGIKN